MTVRVGMCYRGGRGLCGSSIVDGVDVICDWGKGMVLRSNDQDTITTLTSTVTVKYQPTSLVPRLSPEDEWGTHKMGKYLRGFIS